MTVMQIDRAVVEQVLEALVWEAGSEPALYAAQTDKAITALRAALAQQAEPVQEPYTSERHFALREAYCIGAADAFWKERPGTKDDGRTIAFDAGFARGFDKGTCLAEQRLAALAQQDEPEAYGYASRLAVAIWEKHYKDTAPQWKPLDDLIGVLTQIDNMTSGLTLQEAAAELRRLHADNKLICSALNGWIRENSPGGWIDDLRAQRAALLEALKMIAGETPCFDNLMGDKDIARAAIKAVEETK